MTVITISHQMGSGARAIGQAAAAELNLSYVDREIVQQVARLLNLREEVAALHDEEVDGVVAQVLRALADGPGLVFGGPPLDPDLRVDDVTCNRTARTVIEGVARSNLVLIAGHGANFALAGRKGVLSAFLYAPLEHRIATVMQRDGLTRAEAARRVAHSDQARAHYVRHHYHADWQSPAHYHLMLDTAALGPALAAEMVVRAWRGGAFGPFR